MLLQKWEIYKWRPGAYRQIKLMMTDEPQEVQTEVKKLRNKNSFWNVSYRKIERNTVLFKKD
jgi:hypothetical protein